MCDNKIRKLMNERVSQRIKDVLRLFALWSSAVALFATNEMKRCLTSLSNTLIASLSFVLTITRACFILNILDSREDIADVIRVAEVTV